MKNILFIRHIGYKPWSEVCSMMDIFTENRDTRSMDEIWFTEHPPVFTIGRSGDKSDIIKNNMNIPIKYSNRGGKISYHGPGQLIMYVLINVKKNKIYARKLVNILEQTVIKTLNILHIPSHTIIGYPGVYVKNEKLCSIGLRIHNGYSSYGLSINVNMDLTPFTFINVCGQKHVMVTQISNFIKEIKLHELQKILVNSFLKELISNTKRTWTLTNTHYKQTSHDSAT